MSPDSGGAVMATGIVSVALWLSNAGLLSDVLLGLTAALWATLATIVVARAFDPPSRWRSAARRPSALTAVAGSAVLGTRLTFLGWRWAGWSLLALAVILWLGLAPLTTIADHAPGATFLIAVAPQSLAVLAASLARPTGALWPALVALAPFAFGLAAYAIALVRFDFAQLRVGRGDQWVAGGALAISTLACGQIARALIAHQGWAGEAFRIATIVLWGLSVAWLPALVLPEVRRPRPGYHVARWATVFPVGMYAVMSVTAGQVATTQPLIDIGRVITWISLAVWCWVAAGAARNAVARTRRAPTGRSGA